MTKEDLKIRAFCERYDSGTFSKSVNPQCSSAFINNLDLYWMSLHIGVGTLLQCHQPWFPQTDHLKYCSAEHILL